MKEAFRTGGIQERKDIGKKDSEQGGCGTRGIQNSWDARLE